jgi:tetratricopeptide (TPR) repeat protein
MSSRAPITGGHRRLLNALLLCGLLTQVAVAAPGPADKTARELFQKAEMSFNLGHFTEALDDYQSAYQAKPLPAFLFNIAQCYRNLKNYERAQFFFRRYLALDPHTANRRLVEDLINEMTHLAQRADQPPSAPPTLAAAPSAVEPLLLEPRSPAQSLVIQPRLPEPSPGRAPIYRRWWFWGGIAAVLVAGAAVTWTLTRDGAPQGSLETINGR